MEDIGAAGERSEGSGVVDVVATTRQVGTVLRHAVALALRPGWEAEAAARRLVELIRPDAHLLRAARARAVLVLSEQPSPVGRRVYETLAWALRSAAMPRSDSSSGT